MYLRGHIPCPIIDVLPILSKCLELGNMLLCKKWYLFGCYQMLPLVCILLHPNRLNINKIIPQNVNDHVYYSGAENKSFYSVAYVFY